MGLHTGEGELDADGAYVGHDVHRAARVGAAGHGGQVLLSEATATLVDGRLPAGPDPPVARRAPAQGPAAGADRPARDRRPARGLPADPLARRPAQQPADGAHRRSSGGSASSRRSRALLASDAAADADGSRRHRQDAPRAAGRGKPRRRVPGRRLVRAAGQRHGPGRSSSRRSRARSGSATTRRAARSTCSATELEPKRALLVLDNLEQVRGAGRRHRGAAASRGPDPDPRHEPRRRCGSPASRSTRSPGCPSPLDLDRLGPLEREQPARGDPARAIRRRWRPSSRSGCSSPAASAVRPGFADHRRQRRGRRRDRRPPRRRAARHRAGRRADPVPHAGRDPRAARGPARPAGRRRGRRPGAPAVAARRDHVEPRAARRARLPPVRAAARVRGRLRPAAGGGGAPAPADRTGGRRRRARRPGVPRGPEPRAERRGPDGEPRFSMLEPIREYALERLEAAGERRCRRRATRPRLPGARRGAGAGAQRRRPAGRARPSRARAREPARRHRLGATRGPTPRSRSGSRSRSGGCGRSAATCARRGSASPR